MKIRGKQYTRAHRLAPGTAQRPHCHGSPRLCSHSPCVVGETWHLLVALVNCRQSDWTPSQGKRGAQIFCFISLLFFVLSTLKSDVVLRHVNVFESFWTQHGSTDTNASFLSHVMLFFYLPSLLVCRYIKVKMTKDKTPKKQLLLIYICWFYCFIPILQTHRVHSLQRVEWLISNNFKDHSWQFNTVLQFMAPCVGRMFFWKVVREFMAAGCTSATPFIS